MVAGGELVGHLAKKKGGRREGTMPARKARETLSPLLASLLYPPPSTATLPLLHEATEILEIPLCFWLLERVKIPARKLHLGHGGSLKMFRKRRARRIIPD